MPKSEPKLKSVSAEVDVSWQAVKGHDDLIAAFGRAVARGRLAHAYLFTGPPGVGKKLFARQLAMTLLCESPPNGKFDSCDHCVACRLVDAGTHPDLFLVSRPEDKQELPIDTMRELGHNLALKPARGGRKIAVVDDADDLNDASANSFLKTLEEPAPHSLLILIGTNADLQLPTIRSRCQEMPFAPLPSATVRELLGESEIDPSLLDRLSKFGDGSPGLARELAEPALWAFRRQLMDSLTRPNADSPALSARLMGLVEEAGKDSGAQRRRAALIIRLLVDGFRRALARSLGGPPPVDPLDGPVFEHVAQKIGPDGLVQRLDRCLEADRQVDRKVQLVMALEGLVDALCFG
jgi:DNA polymerase-3 subunit delta'